MFVMHECLCQKILFKVLNFSFLRNVLALLELLVVTSPLNWKWRKERAAPLKRAI